MTNPIQKMLAGLAAVAALALGGSAIAGAASSGTSTAPAGTSSTAAQQAHANIPAHGSAAHEDQEKPATGDAAAKAKAAAVKSLGGGTAGEVTTDFTGNGYEVTVTKSDGSKVEVHLDNSFNVADHGGAPGGYGPGGGAPGA
jgi:hypothetical protein